jgi:hypothetical protein
VTAVFSKLFTDDPLVARSTPVKADHILGLRSAIDTLRARGGLAAFAYTDPGLTPGNIPIRAVHLTDLRTALTQAYQAAMRAAPTYAEAITSRQTSIAASHLSELRAAIRALE